MEFKHRVGFSIGGGIVGLLGSYFFRPISEMSGRGPSLGAWITEGWTHGYAGTMLVSIIVAGCIGFAIGMILDKKK